MQHLPTLIEDDLIRGGKKIAYLLTYFTYGKKITLADSALLEKLFSTTDFEKDHPPIRRVDNRWTPRIRSNQPDETFIRQTREEIEYCRYHHQSYCYSYKQLILILKTSLRKRV